MSVRFRARSLWLVPALLAAAAAHPDIARAAGLDVWNVDEAHAEIAEAAARDRELGDRDETILRRIAIKEGLISDLVAGRAALADVAEAFLELSDADPAYLSVLRTTVPGDSDLERAARNAIDYAGQRFPDPAARAAVLARLEAELARMQDADHPAVP